MTSSRRRISSHEISPGGQRARVSLAAALVGRPRLLLLDEPTVGLDPLLRRRLWTLFGELAAEDATLIVSSHVLDEARHCDQLMLLRDGRLLVQLTPGELASRAGTEDMDEALVRLIEDACPGLDAGHRPPRAHPTAPRSAHDRADDRRAVRARDVAAADLRASPGVFDQAGGPLLAIFPCLLSAVQAGVANALTLGVLGPPVRGSAALLVVLAIAVALLGMGLGLFASAFARSEVPGRPALTVDDLSQLLLGGLLVARERMPAALHAISDLLPMSYAVDGMHHLSRQPNASGALIGDVAIVLGFAVRRNLRGRGHDASANGLRSWQRRFRRPE